MRFVLIAVFMVNPYQKFSTNNDVHIMDSDLYLRYEPWHEISNNLVCVTSKGSDQPAHTRSLISAFASWTVKLLTEHYLECLSLSGGCTDSSKS